ncbi:DNA polymerase III subunit delta [uncultured Umboniibacter sp.]|uniref:DNA polymerase III subunit delta n=1 Tax=uncultured Umboniibacter sp. TaxID=1798917 RepID=UPI002603A08F|nr:DNA polymerase III subunit delta [uncultured Umboniibacter sp.]
MKIQREALEKTFRAQPHGLYWISGDEPLLNIESADLLRRLAKDSGYLERERYVMEHNSDWEPIMASVGTLSLFASQKFIDIQFNAKFNDKFKAAMAYLVEQRDDQTLIVLSTTKVEASATKAKWFNSIEQHATHLPIWPIKSDEFKQWIVTRLESEQLAIEDDALAILAQRTEGNLLAASQEISALKLLDSDGILTAEKILEATADSARYDAFQLIEHALKGDISAAIRALNGLRGEGTEPIIVLSAIAANIRQLMAVKKLLAARSANDAELKRLGIFFNRVHLMREAAKRLTAVSLKMALEYCASADEAIKTSQTDYAWHQLEKLSLLLSGMMPEEVS